MSLNREEKRKVVAEMATGAATAETMVIAEYRGISAGELTHLRTKAHEKEVHLQVVKNTLARRAVADTAFSTLANYMVGPLIYSLSKDPIAAAKVLFDFSKTNNNLVIKAGMYQGKVLDAQEVGLLASIPSREALLAQLLGTMQATISGFVRTLAAIRDKKEAEAA